MAEIGVRLGGDNSAFRGMLDESEAALGKFGRSIGTLLPALSAGAVSGFFKNILEEAGALQDLSDRLSVSTDSLQAFNFAVTQAGGKTEDATKAWDKARQSVDALVGGSDEMAKKFQAIGLSAEDFINLNLEQSLEKIARAYVENKDVAGAYDAVADILGSKTLPKVMVGLEQLANDGFPALSASARQAMQVMDAEVIAKLDDFGDRMARIWTAIKTGGSEVAGVVFKLGDALGTVAAGVVGLFKGWDISAAGEALNPTKAVDGMKKVTTEMELALASVKNQQKAEKEKEDARAKMVKENEEAAAKAMKLKKAEDDAEDKRNAAQNKAARELVDQEYKLVQLAMERAKAQGAVTSEFSKQLSEIQKMGGAGQGGFKATASGGKEGTTTVAALENVLANAKKAVEVAYKNINDAEGARNLVEAKALVDQSERNLLKAQNQQGMGSPVEILISGLDFTSLKQTSDAAFGSREQNALDKELLAVAKETRMSSKEIEAAVKTIKKTLEE
jgi:hypothetical protein